MNSNGNLDKNTSMLSEIAETEEDSIAFGIIKSPGSLLGSSIRSNQVESFDMESESCSVTGENPGWRLGMPWFSNSINHNRDLRNIDLSTHYANRYYGGIMKASGESSSNWPATPSSTTSTDSREFLSFRKSKMFSNSSNKGRSTADKNKRSYENTDAKKSAKSQNEINDRDNASVPIARTKSNTADSIADFDDSEWTPPDSSYGAACPVCGCIPKRARQMIEMTLIAAMVFFLIYLVVTTSMKIADAHRREGRVDGSASGSAADNYFSGNNYNRTGTNSAVSTNVITDDDVYVEKNNNNNNNDGANGDYVADRDDNYNDDYSHNQYSNDDNSKSQSDYSQNYNYKGNQNYNENENQNYNYNYYNRNRRYYQYTDDFNGGRRLLRSSRGMMESL